MVFKSSNLVVINTISRPPVFRCYPVVRPRNTSEVPVRQRDRKDQRSPAEIGNQIQGNSAAGDRDSSVEEETEPGKTERRHFWEHLYNPGTSIKSFLE